MQKVLDEMKSFLAKINCCKSNRRTISHHNLLIDTQENAEVHPIPKASDPLTPHVSKSVHKTKSINERNIWIDDPIASSLWEYSLNNNLKKVKELLDSHINILELNSQHPEGIPLLHKSVLLHNPELSSLLLSFSPFININSTDKYKRTALHLACIEKLFTTVKLLIDAGALINLLDSNLNTALHYAILSENTEIIEFIVCNCPDLELKNDQGFTAIDLLKQKNIDFNDNASEIFTISEYDEFEVNVSIPDGVCPPDRPPTLRDFDPVQIIGRGSFGEVFLVKQKLTGELYAMKVLKKEKIFSQNLIRYVMTERNVLSYINHPFIVRLNFAFQDSEKLFLMLEYCPGGNLAACIHRFGTLSEDIARIYMCEILLAIAELHRRGIIYRDLKPDNVILDASGHALITDFGLSKEGVLDNVSANSFCGSVAYLAPEVIKRQGHGKAVDWYLLGILLFEMLTGKPPYYNNNRQVLLYNIEYTKLKIPRNLSETSRDILKKLLRKDPSCRLGSLNDAEEVKQHEFFKGIDWNAVINKELKPPVPPVALIKTEMMAGYKVHNDVNNSDTRLNGWTFVSD